MSSQSNSPLLFLFAYMCTSIAVVDDIMIYACASNTLIHRMASSLVVSIHTYTHAWCPHCSVSTYLHTLSSRCPHPHTCTHSPVHACVVPTLLGPHTLARTLQYMHVWCPHCLVPTHLHALSSTRMHGAHTAWSLAHALQYMHAWCPRPHIM